MSSPKRHHIIPRFFLERFSRDGLLWVYDRDRDSRRRQAPHNTAVMKDYYTIRDAEGVRHTVVEETLSRIESDAKPLLDRLDQREPITEEEHYTLALFIAFLDTRVPEFARGLDEVTDGMMKRVAAMTFGDATRAAEWIRRYEADTGKAFGLSPEELAEATRNQDDYVIELTPAARLGHVLELALAMAPVLMEFDWVIVHTSPKKSFVTSDNPFTLMPPPGAGDSFYGVGLRTPGAMKFIALGARIGLVMRDPGDAVGHVDIEDTHVRTFNLNVALRAEHFVFARDEALLRSVVAKTGLATTARGPKIRVT